MRIAPEHQQQLQRHGYAIVPGFLGHEELSAARENMLRYVPTSEELAKTPERYSWIYDDPANLQTEFPFAGDALNDVSTHPDIIAFVESLLGTREILLSQAAIWAKYAGLDADYEQGLHLDYQGNSLVVPRDDGSFRQVNFILYYTDVEDDSMGPTYVVSHEHAQSLPLWPTHRPRKKNAELYKHERPILAKAGDLLIFGMRTWHRAGAVTAESGVRLSHHLVYRAKDQAFQGYHQWSRYGEKPELQRFVTRTTPRQREVLGFPPPGDAYWNEETIAAVGMRYPGMDMKPYQRD